MRHYLCGQNGNRILSLNEIFTINYKAFIVCALHPTLCHTQRAWNILLKDTQRGLWPIYFIHPLYTYRHTDASRRMRTSQCWSFLATSVVGTVFVYVYVSILYIYYYATLWPWLPWLNVLPTLVIMDSDSEPLSVQSARIHVSLRAYPFIKFI